MREISVSVDLRAQFGPARDQAARPTCLAFAASDAHAGLRDGWAPLSCEYAFYNAQRRAKRSHITGALLSSMLEALRNDGQPEENGWPYLAAAPANPESWKPPSDVGTLFHRDGSEIPHTLDRIVAELDRKRPVLLLLMLSRSFYARHPQAIVDLEAGELPDPERRHAVVAVGHGRLSDQRAFLIRNSWGPSWGEHGYGWLTESYLAPRMFGAALLQEEAHVFASPAAA